MALIHRATVSPAKLDLLTAWLPGRPWFVGGLPLHQVGAYRFDDPAGAVGVETLLVRGGQGPVLQVPLTYRGAPVDALTPHLAGVTQHSVLGPRWVYDGCADPVWALTLATAVLTGGGQAEELVDSGEAGLVPREPTVTVRGSGTPDTPVPVLAGPVARDDGAVTLVRAGGVELALVRVIGATADGTHTLTGSWAGSAPALLAAVALPT